MNLTDQEIQQRIDRSSPVDIKELTEDKFISRLTANTYLNQFSLNKKFIHKFLFENINELLANGTTSGHTIRWTEIVAAASETIESLDFSESDWAAYIPFVYELVSEHGAKEPNSVRGLIGKNAAYFRYIIANADTVSPKLNEISQSDLRWIPAGFIQTLTSAERGQFYEFFSIFPGTTVAFANPSDLMEFGDISDIVGLVEKFLDPNAPRLSIELDRVYEDASIEDIDRVLTYLIEQNTLISTRLIIQLLVWFQTHDEQLNTELVKKIVHNYNNTAHSNLIYGVSKEDALKYFGGVSANILLKNKRITLSDIPYQANTGNVDIFGSRFFTEEEILEYPHFFNPGRIKYNAYAYITKDTLKILNRTWGKRVKYNPDLIDFTSIVVDSNNNNNINTSIEDIKYIVDKTNPSNKTILTTLARAASRHSALLSASLKEIVSLYSNSK